jgi:selenocysteine-specific elongation factor
VGEIGWAQLELKEALPVLKGQRFIARVPSPSATIGGGIILDTHPARKWKRHHPDVEARFKRLASGTPLDLLSETLIQLERPVHIHELITQFPNLHDMSLDDSILIEGEWLLHRQTYQQITTKLQKILTVFHADFPLHQGMQLSTFQAQLGLELEPAKIMMQILQREGVIQVHRGKFVRLHDFLPKYSRSQKVAVDRLLKTFAENPYAPPSVKEAIEVVGENILEALIQQGEFIRLGADVLLGMEVYREWLQYVYQRLRAGESLKLADFRDAFQTSRKYVLAFLDHLDSLDLTRRLDDVHTLGHGNWDKVLRDPA